ncbi:LppU/SCO3897 family protein [Streptomyces cacaoi]
MSTLPPLPGPESGAHRLLKARRRLLVYVASLAVVVVAGIGIKALMKDDTEALKAGDCFRNNGTEDEPETERLDCSDKNAEYKVIKVVEDGVTSLACSDVPGSTGALSQFGTRAGEKTFAICFRAAS